MKRLGMVLLLIFAFATSSWGQKAWDGGAGTTNWGDGNNWNPNGVPTLATGAVTIGSGYTVVVNGTFSCPSLALSANGANTTLNFNTGSQLTITGAITFNNPSANNINQTINVNDGTLSCGSITMANCTNGGLRTNNLNISTGTVTVNGNLTTNGAANENYVNITDAGTLNLGGTFTAGTFNISGTGSTVKWFDNGTNFRSGVNYYHLILQLPATATAIRTKAMTAATTIGGNLTIESLHATRTLTFNPAGFNLTVNGTTTINARGVLNDNTNGGTNRFDDLVTIAANGQFINTNNPVYEFRGGITNDGTFTKSGTGTATFSTNSQSISGSSALTFSGGDFIISDPISLSVSTDISFSGTNFTNNSDAVSAFNATSGTFTFVPNAAQNINGGGAGTISFYNLTAGGGNTKTANLPFTVVNNLTVTAATLNFGATAKTISVGGNLSGTGGINMSGAASHVLNLGGINNAITTFTTVDGNTVNYNGTGDQQVFASANYRYLTVLGGGIKTMQGNVTINNNLNLNDGVLSLGAGAFSLIINDGATITGSFDNTHMIRCDGTGYVLKYSDTNAGFVMVFPVGTSTFYTPFEITSLSSTVVAGAFIRIRAVAGVAPFANGTDLNKHWVILTSGISAINANASFTYVDPNEVNGDQLVYSLNRYTGTAWAAPSGVSGPGSNPMTTTGTNVLSGTWTARETTRTLYSYQSGDWGTAANWTTDPSGTLSIAPAVPGAGDRVVILNGRTISTAVARTVYSLQINEGGILDIAGITGHDFGSVSGKGLLRLSTATFPGGTFTSFVAAGGGTVEYYNTANFDFSQFDYNNLILNFSNSGIRSTLLGDMTINGNLTITTGLLRINDNNANSRTVNIFGNVIVSANGSISIGTGNVNHHFIVGGDFTNDGTVRFTNLIAPDYVNPAVNGRADAVFNNPTKDQSILCNNTTDFYRIEIDKGVDQTYVLNIDASAVANFGLYGRNNLQYFNPIDIGETVGNLSNNNALGLLAGTVRLGENIVVPCLATDNGSYGVYTVDEDARIWVDGGTLVHNPVNQFYDPLLYGGLRMTGNNSYVDFRNGSNGLVLRINALVSIEDGIFDGSCIRVSSRDETTSHRGTYFQSGGTVNLFGNTTTTFAATFTLPYSTMGFNMSGGTLNLLAPSNAGGTGNNFSFIVTSDINNATVTGGQINITVPNGGNANILTTVPLWNLTILGAGAGTSAITAYGGSGAGPTVPAVALQPLTILNDFNISGSKTFNCNNQNLTIGHDFIMSATSTYSPGTNTTTFNANGSQTFDASGVITGNFQNITLSNISDLSLINNDITLNGNLIIGDGCTLRDNGRIITVLGNITNSGTHFKPVSGAGSIRLTGVAVQTITGDGTGSFNNLFLNKTGGSTTITANMSITGDLRLANTTARLNIGSNNLLFSADGDVFDNLTGTGKAFGPNRMIQTNGFASDGGVSKTFNNTNAFIFPYGFYNTPNTTYYYMPGSVQFSSAPTISYGTVTSSPVNMRHPLAQGANNALTCYWKTTSNGFAGIPAGTVRHIYTYDPTPTNYFVPVPANEPLYVPGVYSSSTTTWNYINDVNLVDQANNIISYNVANGADGDFSAGEPSAFTTIPIRYSTGVNGDWDNTASWSLVGVGGAGGASIPTANTIVIIGDATHNHTVTVNQANRTAGSLFIATGSTLDLKQYQGHTFATLPDGGISGSGTLRIASSNYFPNSDFGDFIGATGGTVEYYTIAALPVNITIPLVSAGAALQLGTYKNLILSPSPGYNITLPDRDLTIYGNLTISGIGNGANDGARTRNAGTSRTYTVNGNLDVNSGLLEYRNGVISTIRVLGNTNVNGTAIFRVLNSAAVNNVLEMYGDLTVAAGATFNMSNGTGRVLSSFKGTNNAAISGTGTIGFYNLTVDKGTNSTPILTLNSNITTGVTNPFLSLLNGTFMVNGPTVEVTNAATNFTIPSTACLSVNAGEVRVAYSGNNNSDLLLTGKLEILGGNMVIGNSANNTNNDIEYAAAGLPEIVVNGGQLFVNGQIRRSTSTTSGSLIYRQTAGSTIINGRNNQPQRAKFEIVNTGSLFNTTGGTLTIVSNGGGNNYGDAYIRPDSSAVTGGTIQFGDNTSTAGSNFSFSTTIPLWNLTVGTPTVSQNLDLTVLPLTMTNHLKIDGNSVFRANGFAVSIKDSLTNNNSSAGSGIDQGGFQAGSTTQTVTFDGTGNQTFTGNGTNLTNFANLIIASGGTVTLSTNSNLQVNKNLTLSTGTLASANNNIYVFGNIDNSAIHTSWWGTNGIVFSGTSKQYLSGNGLGIFGNVNINNSSGVDMLDDTQIEGRLNFTNGPLYIDDYLLTLGYNAIVSGAFSPTRMILFNGALSDRGVKKLFPAGASPIFTIPVGVAGKYTPVSFTITANSASGSIVVSPVNSKHPATTDALTNELAFYWYVRSSGFSGLAITHTYNYIATDASGVLANYVGGRYNLGSNTWTNLGSVVNTVARTITLTGVNYITGEYTAGEPSNFGTIIPLYSRTNRPNNNWNDPQSWTTSPDGSDCADANCTADHATNAPNGNPVTILAPHTIILNVNSAYSYSINVIGNLDCSNTTFHSLGHVFGTGKIDITSTAGGIFVFPGGEFDSFFDTPGTFLEFKGTSNATLPLKPGNVYKPYQNVIFSGTGIKYMSAENMKILSNMTIRSGTVLSNSLYNKTLYLLGNWTDENTIADGFVPGTGTVSFEGTTPQLITLGRTEKFYTLKINNAAGVDLTTSSAGTGVQVSKYLYLTLGNIKSFSDKLVTITNTSVSAIVGGSATSFIDGYLRKNITNGSYFYFPVGAGGRYARLYISGTTGGTGYWTSSYVYDNPHPTYPTAVANLNSPITSVSNNEYWVINRPLPASTARIRLRWDATSYPAYTSDALLRSRLRVVEYEGGAVTKWSERGNIVSGNAVAGTVSTSANVTQNDYIFTLGIIGVSATISDLTDKSVCNNGEIVSIPVNLTGTAPWTLNYRTTGGVTTNFSQTGILTSPYTIQLTGADIGGSTNSPYTLSLVSVNDASSAGICNPSPVTITIKPTFTPNITGTFAVGSGETRAYSTTANAGSTYAWSWVGASGGSFNTATSNPTDITFNTGTGTFQLQVIETSSSLCTASDVQAIEVSLVPVPDISPTTANVCQNSIITYSTPNIVGNEYKWTVTNGTCTTPGYNVFSAGNNSISVTWDLTGSSSITVEERIAAQPSVIGTDINTYEVYPAPSNKAVSVGTSPICAGESTSISVINSESGISYQLRDDNGDVNLGTAVAGTGGDISLPTGALTPAGLYTFNVLAYNLGCQLEVPTPPLPTVTVNPLPTATITGLVTSGYSCEGDQVQIEIVFTGAPPFAFTMEDGRGNSWSETGIAVASGVTYTYDVPLVHSVWVSPLLPTSYTYALTDASDDNGCSATSISGSAAVDVYKRPETGPQYHIPNSKSL